MLPSSENLVIHPYFDTYLNLVQHPDIHEELVDSSKLVLNKLKALAETDLSFRYAPEKWTIEQLVLHCIETESIFNFRALTIARGQSKPTLEGFDENYYAASVNSEAFNLNALISYFQNVRGSTMHLLQSMRADQLDKIGSASGHDVEVKALFFATSGHWRHHMNVLNEKYLSN